MLFAKFFPSVPASSNAKSPLQHDIAHALPEGPFIHCGRFHLQPQAKLFPMQTYQKIFLFHYGVTFQGLGIGNRKG
ncbi:MAG: hypothetical protein QXZ02_00875 [Candidatus Bathyarchaeia archaeon]